MGVLGPQRVVVNDGDFAPPPPAKRVDNAYSVLDVADLVMIDPVGTGFSRPIGEAEGKDFWGVDQDIESVARFIKDYISEQGRWASRSSFSVRATAASAPPDSRITCRAGTACS